MSNGNFDSVRGSQVTATISELLATCNNTHSTRAPAMPSHAAKPLKTKKRAKDDLEEEADLEAQLFGTKKSSKKTSKRSKHDDEEDTGMGWMQDSEVSFPLQMLS